MKKPCFIMLAAPLVGVCIYLATARVEIASKPSTQTNGGKASVKAASPLRDDLEESAQHAARAQTLIAKFRQKKAAFSDYAQKESVFDKTEVEVRRLRGEALKEVHRPEDWDRLGPDQLAKVDHANEIETKAHNDLVHAFNKLEGRTK